MLYRMALVKLHILSIDGASSERLWLYCTACLEPRDLPAVGGDAGWLVLFLLQVMKN